MTLVNRAAVAGITIIVIIVACVEIVARDIGTISRGTFQVTQVIQVIRNGLTLQPHLLILRAEL